MGKGIGLIVGGMLTVLGVLGIVYWWSAVVILLKAGIAIAALLIGLGAIIFGLGELRTPPETSGAAVLPSKAEAKPTETSHEETTPPPTEKEES